MRTSLAREDMERYRGAGFLVVPELLDVGELDLWRRAVDAAVAERADRIPGMGASRGSSYYDKVFTQRVNLWQTNPLVRELVLDARIGKLACDLEGLNGIRVWHDQALIKEPYANPTGFHLDVPYWSFTSERAITVWVALDDATLSNGALCYLPGSHTARRFENVGIGPELGALFEVYPEWRDVEPVFCPVGAGAAIFHNGLVAHGAGANMTPRRRRAMTIQFMPDGSTFNGTQNVLPEAYFKTLRVGDVLDSDEQNPLVYRRE